MKALTRSQRTRLLVSAVPALGVALVLTAASLWGLLAATRARVGDLLFTTRPGKQNPFDLRQEPDRVVGSRRPDLRDRVHVGQDGVFQGALPPTPRPIDALSGSDPGGR